MPEEHIRPGLCKGVGTKGVRKVTEKVRGFWVVWGKLRREGVLLGGAGKFSYGNLVCLKKMREVQKATWTQLANVNEGLSSGPG